MEGLKRELFGGAILSSLAENFVDISNIRPVPDHQEVFIDQNTEASVIVELLDTEQSVPDDLKAINYYFLDLASFNESVENIVLSEALLTAETFVPSLEQSVCKMALIGTQKAGKYRTRPDMELDTVVVVLVLIRLAAVGTDLLISMNIPAAGLEQPEGEGDVTKATTTNGTNQLASGSFNIVQLLPESDGSSGSSGSSSSTIRPSAQAVAAGAGAGAAKHPIGHYFAVLREFVNALEIKDWSLFGEESK
jgi:hypothetical protein